MGLLNLALGQLLGLFLPLAAGLVALYFYDRSRRRVLVSTLRFWPRRPAPAVRQRHKRIQHPFSLALQLIALLLLLLAIADPRPDAVGPASQRRAILLDTSSSMELSDDDGQQLMDQAKALALAYLDSVPSRDQIVLIAADGAPSVRVPFTADRGQLRESILAAVPGPTALDLAAAFDLAAGTLRLALDAGGETLPAGRQTAEAVYIGPGLFAGQPIRSDVAPAVRFLQTGQPSDSLGLIALRASADPSENDKWSVELGARNYENEVLTASIEFFFDEQRLGHRPMSIPAGEDASLRFTLRTGRPGRLLARAIVEDGHAANNEALLEIPGSRRTQLQVVGASESAFEPLLASGAWVNPTFVQSPDELVDGAIHVWANGAQNARSRRAIYLAPPGMASPAEEVTAVRDQPVAEWSPSHPLAQGVRDPEFTPSRMRVFETLVGDEVVASTAEGPVILARATREARSVTFGFDLADDSVRNRLAAPLLFANAVAWLDAGAFQPESVEARSPGAVAIEAPNSSFEQVSVRNSNGESIPWLLSDGVVRFYAGQPGTYRVATADRTVTLHLDQPQVPAGKWDPDNALRRLPAKTAGSGPPGALWPWLAALAGLILLYDWIRFGRGRRLSAAAFRAAEQGAETP